MYDGAMVTKLPLLDAVPAGEACCAPLVQEQQARGCFYLDHPELSAFGATEQYLLEILATHGLLHWVVTEHGEEEASALEWVNKLEMVGDSKPGLYMMDREAAARAFKG